MEQGMCMGVSPIASGVAEYGDGAHKPIPKKEKDTRIAELEQQLAIAENRCTTLRKQVEYMRLLYDGVEKPMEGAGEARGYQVHKTADEKKLGDTGDTHFFPERQQRTKQCIVSEPCSFKDKFLSDFNEGFVSEITGSKQHVGKDPKDVVQIILSGMTRSINDISDPELQIKSSSKSVATIKKGLTHAELKKADSESTKAKPKTIAPTKSKVVKSRLYDDNKSKGDRVPVKKPAKKDCSGAGSKPISRQTGRANSIKSNPPKQKKIVKPLKATKPTIYKSKIQEQQKPTHAPQQQQPQQQQQQQHQGGKTLSSVPSREDPHLNPERRRSKSSCEYVKSTYQLPTVSYRMKCVPKSLNAHFNIKNIPFVVGMSTTKSHNLGMKVQETLSLIKLNNRTAISQTALADPDSELGSLLKYCPSQIPFNQPRPRYVVGHGSLGNMKKPGSLLQAKASSVSMGTSVDYKNYQLRNVLVNLHDEFSKMTMRYDELQALVKEKKDLGADKELQKLEEDLTAKENEINAIMGLYNEVTDLKDKLTYMEKKASSTSLFVRNDSFTRTISSNGLKMTRLLRKIEEFQDSLKANTFI